MNKKQLTYLQIGVLIPTLLFVFLYAINPLQKQYNLISIAIIFTVLLLLAAIIFKKNGFYRIISYYVTFTLLILSYLIL
ncbi:MAG: hypothetical protein GX905_03955 [Bacteroidales bacterium]|nr:hypothetical protein [Bacteroidales bacterium]